MNDEDFKREILVWPEMVSITLTDPGGDILVSRCCLTIKHYLAFCAKDLAAWNGNLLPSIERTWILNERTT